MGNGEWSFDGLTTNLVSNQSVQCLSTHLTSFAILVNVGRSGGGNTSVVSQLERCVENQFTSSLYRYFDVNKHKPDAPVGQCGIHHSHTYILYTFIIIIL